MNVLQTVVENPTLEQAGWSLLHSVWLIALIALAYSMAIAALRNCSSDSRYVAGCFALAAMLMALPVTFCIIAPNTRSSTPPSNTHAAAVEHSAVVVESMFPENMESATPERIGDSSVTAMITMADALPATEVEADWELTFLTWKHVGAVIPWLTISWIAGVIALSLRPMRGLIVVRRLRTMGLAPLPEDVMRLAQETAQQIGAGRAVRFFQSAKVEVPTVLGYFKPVVLLPISAMTHLTAEQLELILAHELAHVRRHDYLVNVAQTLIESLLFYHPAVWWISHQIRKERENCCDDMAIASCGKREAYARALWTLEKQRVASLDPALAATGGELLTRIQRLVGASTAVEGRRQRRTAWLAGTSAIAIVACLLTLTLGDSFARSDGDNNADPTAEVAEMVVFAGSDHPEDPQSAKALRELKELGLAEHVVPLLSGHAGDLVTIDRQQAAARILRRSGYTGAMDPLGRCLEANRRTWVAANPTQQEQGIAAAHRRLKRELIAAIYELARRPNPIADRDSAEAIDDAIAPTLRYVSALKPADARRMALPADDPRNDVQVRVHTDKDEWLLGEPVLLHYQVKNSGSKPADANFGADSRTWPARSLRFKVIAIDDRANLVDDPYPSRMCAGGPGGVITLPPNESHWEAIPLWRSCAIVRPGVYKIRIYHDLGWDGDDCFNNTDLTHPPLASHFAPVLEATLTFRKPTPAEARDMVGRVLDMPRRSNRTWGERADPYGDLTAIAHPVYLPILREYIDEGNHDCVTAIGAIPFSEATAALIDLTNHSAEEVRELATAQLLGRLPNAPPTSENRRWLAERSWRDAYRHAALARGWQLLDVRDRASQIQGADILAACGAAEDMARYLEKFNQAIRHFRNDPVEQDRYPRPAHACGSLLQAGTALLERGATAPTSATRPAEGLMMLKAMSRDEDFRPDSWEEAVESLLSDPIPFVRATAVENLPRPVAEQFHDLIIDLLNDRHLLVQTAACHLAGQLELSAAAQTLLGVLRSAEDRWLISASHTAAARCGATPYQLAEICVKRMDEPGVEQRFFTLLLPLLDCRESWSASHVDWSVAGDLQSRWLKLLKSNRAKIAAGERLEIGKPPVTHALFPRGFQATLHDASSWPNWSEIEGESNVRSRSDQRDATKRPANQSASLERTASLTGRFIYDGKPSGPKEIEISPYLSTHDGERIIIPERLRWKEIGVPDESLIVGEESGIANVIVWLRSREVPSPAAPGEAPPPVIVRANNGRFQPHVRAFWKAAPLKWINEMPEAVNFNWNALGNSRNILLSQMRREYEFEVKRAGRVPAVLTSNLQPWMRAYLLPLDHPYFAVSGKDGRFEIKALPPGTWEFAFWHERCGSSGGWLATERFPNGRFRLKLRPDENALGDLLVNPDTISANQLRLQHDPVGQTDSDTFFPRDPYPELGILRNAGPGWHFLRVAGHARASDNLEISSDQQVAILALFHAHLVKDRELEARLRQEHGGLPKKLWESARRAHWLEAREEARRLLTEPQIRRVEQMLVLREGFHAFLREDVQEALQLRGEQLAEITAGIRRHYQQKGRESLRRLGKEISRILTPQQRERFDELRGSS